LLEVAVTVVEWGEMAAVVLVTIAAVHLLRGPVWSAILLTAVFGGIFMLTGFRFSLAIAVGVDFIVEALASSGADINFVLSSAVGYFGDAKWINKLSL
jgi:hypothetical protein